MRTRKRKNLAIAMILMFAIFTLGVVFSSEGFEKDVLAQEVETKPTVEAKPTPEFDQKAAIAKIKERIKGKEDVPAGEVFKNVKDFAEFPAGRLLAIMEFGYARSLGVDCTHCHTPENWASDEKTAKQTARAMRAMSDKINGELLPAIKAFEGRTGRQSPVVNCTTCHRGEVKPATNLGP